MNKKLAKLIIILSLLSTLLALSSCNSAYGPNRGCSEGDLCSYYVGSRGVITMLDRPPPVLPYRSSEIGQPDGNSVEFNVRLRNDGASDAYGGVFFHGVGSETFRIFRIDNAGEREVIVPRTRQACHFELFNIRDLTDPSTWNLMARCHGVDFQQFGDRRNLNIGFQQLSERLGNPPWLERLAEAGANIGIQWVDGEITQFNVGGDFGLVRFGRTLMMIVSGLNFEAFGGMTFYLEGDNPAFPGGGIDFKTFRLQLAGPWPAGQDFYDIPYNIKTCYAYTTFVSPMVCIDPDPYSDERKVCSDKSFTWTGSQGAPVAVTRLRTTNLGKEVIVEATIRNIGPGSVWDVGYLEYCSPYFPATVRPSMKNVVYVGYMQLENRPLDCSTTFRVNLDPVTREGRLTCRYDLSNTAYVGSAYSTPLRMELWYGYEENYPGHLRVRRLN